jgi:hypothetical protein
VRKDNVNEMNPAEWCAQFEAAKELARQYPELKSQAMEFDHSGTSSKDGLHVSCTCGWEQHITNVAADDPTRAGMELWSAHSEEEHPWD